MLLFFDVVEYGLHVHLKLLVDFLYDFGFFVVNDVHAEVLGLNCDQVDVIMDVVIQAEGEHFFAVEHVVHVEFIDMWMYKVGRFTMGVVINIHLLRLILLKYHLFVSILLGFVKKNYLFAAVAELSDPVWRILV